MKSIRVTSLAYEKSTESFKRMEGGFMPHKLLAYYAVDTLKSIPIIGEDNIERMTELLFEQGISMYVTLTPDEVAEAIEKFDAES